MTISSLWRRALTVIGVVPNLQYEEFGEDVLADRLQVHVPYAREPWRSVAVLARASVRPAALAEPLRQALRGVDAGVPVFEVRTMTQVRNDTTAGDRILVLIFGSFGVQALVMAAVGLYGLLAYGVAQRRREIGVRLALGAQRWTVVRMILREGAAMALVGVVLGLGGALALTRVMETLLYDVSTTDGWTFSGAVALVTVVALGATYVPARRASRVDPKTALAGD